MMSDPVTKSHGRDDESAVSSVSRGLGDAAKAVADGARPAISTFKDQANEAAQEARATVAALADEAKNRLAEIVDQQKSVGADHVAGVARAAQAAAGDLQQTSPQLARLVRSAADSVDHVAEDLRNSDIADVITTLSDFGRKQPVAFFGGAVVVGFLLARFLKSDAPPRAVGDASDVRSV